MAIGVDIDVLLARRQMSVGSLPATVGVIPANVAVPKNGRAKAVRFSAMEAICRILDCEPGDVFRYILDPDERPQGCTSCLKLY